MNEIHLRSQMSRTRKVPSLLYGTSLKSWSHLTKEHFVKAIGVHATNDLFDESFTKVIDPKCKVILEFPDSDVLPDDSDVDPMDLNLQSLVPNVRIVPSTNL